MSTNGNSFVSGNWKVMPGKEEEFVRVWREFTEWSVQNAPGAQSFILLHDDKDGSHFVSFGRWSDAGSVATWRGRPEFQERLGRCRALCEDFQPTDFSLAAEVKPTGSG